MPTRSMPDDGTKSAAPAGGRAKPLNILFVQCDSMDGRAMGCMGHPALAGATPNIDRLARRGVIFRNAYSNNPICCPSRASMWSGQFTHRCGGWNNYKGLPDGAPTFATHLQAAGYQMPIFGKTDFDSGRHTIRARATAWLRSASIHRPAYVQPPPRVDDGRDVRFRKGDWEKIDGSVAWLKTQSATSQPFMLYCGLNAPHPPFATNRYWLERIDAAKVSIPATDAQLHPVMKYMQVSKNWTHGFNDETVRLTRGIYFAMIAEVDAMVGALVEALEQAGLAETTRVIFTSDHGEMAMEHRQYYKMNMYEPSVRVPLVMAGPGIAAGGAVDDLVSLVDIYPTLMDLAAIEHPDGLDGHSLLPLLGGAKDERRPDWVLTEYHDSSCNTGTFMLRRGDWKYVAYCGYEPQLFNLRDDPDELHDLASARADIVAEMDGRLRGIVDYPAVDAHIKRHDKQSFRRWRQEAMAEGTYRGLMGRIHNGWVGPELQGDAWTDQDELQIEQWLNQDAYD